MQGNRNPIQLFGFIMSKELLDVNSTLDLIQLMNGSFGVCRDIITILQDIFKHQKSGKILIAVNALEYFVKNCNNHFHNASNRQSFQKRLLSLLNRVRGKTNLIKQLNSNTDNWCRIQAKVLYIVQLWYDAFILQESKFTYIINTYKILRKQNITFPPRSKNQKNLMYVQTQSPIFDNIQQIALEDQKKFNKKLASMGMGYLKTRMDRNIQQVQRIQKPKVVRKQNPKKISREINVDQISQKIAIIQSTQFSSQTLKTIQEIKKAIQFGKVKPNEQKYWQQIKIAAQKLIQDWQSRNSQSIQNQQQKYLQRKLGMMGIKNQQKQQQQQKQQEQQNYEQQPDLMDLDFNLIQQKKTPQNNSEIKSKQNVDIWDAFDGINQNNNKFHSNHTNHTINSNLIKQNSKNYPKPNQSSKKQTDLLDLL